MRKLIIDSKALSSTWPEPGSFPADNCYPGCSRWASEDFPQWSQLILECNELPASQTATKTSSSIQRALNPAPLWNIRSSAAIQPPFYLSGYAAGHANVHIVPSFLFSLTTADIRGCITPQASKTALLYDLAASRRAEAARRWISNLKKKKKKKEQNTLDLLKNTQPRPDNGAQPDGTLSSELITLLKQDRLANNQRWRESRK